MSCVSCIQLNPVLKSNKKSVFFSQNKMFKLDLNKVLLPILFVLKISGLWPSAVPSKIYKLYGYIVIVIFSVVLTLPMCIQIFASVEKTSLTDSMFMALTEIALMLKIANFYFRIQSMQNLLGKLKSFHIETDDEREQFDKKLNFIFSAWLIFMIGANMAGFSAQLKVFASPEYILPFPAYYYMDHTDGGAKYWIIYAHQTIGMTLTSNLNVCIEMFPNLLMYMCFVEMEILGMRLRSLGYNITDDESRDIRARDPETTQGKVLRRLKNCIQLHQEIDSLSIRRKFKFIFGLIYFSRFVDWWKMLNKTLQFRFSLK